MANTVKIEKDIYVRDKYGVRRHAFIAGTEVDRDFYNQILTTDTPLDPDALPEVPTENNSKRSISSQVMETKAMDEPKVEVTTSTDGGSFVRERVDEAEGHARAVEATADVAENEPQPAGGPKVNESTSSVESTNEVGDEAEGESK